MNLRERAREIKRDIMTLYLAFRHPDTSWYSKALILVVVGYALSPIDLIPDDIPILGYLDDIIILPFGIILAIKTLPESVLQECRAKASKLPAQRPGSITGAIVIAVIWVVCIFIVGRIIINLF